MNKVFHLCGLIICVRASEDPLNPDNTSACVHQMYFNDLLRAVNGFIVHKLCVPLSLSNIKQQ